MEEKEVTFNIVSGIPEDNGETSVGITSDIDDDIDYLNINERVYLISELITQCCKQIISENFPDNDIEEYDESDEDQEEVRDNLHKLLEELLNITINTICNISRVKFGKKPQQIEFSLATYISKLNFYGKLIHNVDETYHSSDVNAIDPIQASFDFSLDTIFCLLNDGIPKDEVKGLMNDYLTSMKKDFIKIIDEFEKE